MGVVGGGDAFGRHIAAGGDSAMLRGIAGDGHVGGNIRRAAARAPAKTKGRRLVDSVVKLYLPTKICI